MTAVGDLSRHGVTSWRVLELIEATRACAARTGSRSARREVTAVQTTIPRGFAAPRSGSVAVFYHLSDGTGIIWVNPDPTAWDLFRGVGEDVEVSLVHEACHAFSGATAMHNYAFQRRLALALQEVLGWSRREAAVHVVARYSNPRRRLVDFAWLTGALPARPRSLREARKVLRRLDRPPLEEAWDRGRQDLVKRGRR